MRNVSNKIHQNRRHIIKDLSWGEEVLGDIEDVSIDLWKGYKSLVTEIMPKAQVLADRLLYKSLGLSQEVY